MIPPDVFRDQSTLSDGRVRLEPLNAETGAPLIGSLVDMDPEVRRLTGTHQRFTEEMLRGWQRSRPEHHDRADWVIIAEETGETLGDCALLDLDADNACVDYRIALDAMTHTGKGYGTAATDLVLEHAFTVVGLHRVALQVFEYNTNARRSYARSGFREEGRWREHLYWDGEWHDAILMSILAHEYAEFRDRLGTA